MTGWIARLIDAQQSVCTNSILPVLVVHALGLLTFFTLIWPRDSARVLVTAGGADAWFCLHLAQAIVFAALATAAFGRLASIGGRELV